MRIGPLKLGDDTLAIVVIAVLALASGDEQNHPDPDPAASKAAVLDSFHARGFPREEADAAIALESGWKPHTLASNGAAGLVQMMPATLRMLRWSGSPSDFARLSAMEQATWIGRFVARVVASGRKWSKPGDTYVMLAGPAFIGAPDETVMYRIGSPAWKQNPTLRSDHDGDITAGSVRGALLRKMGAVIPPPNAPGYAPLPTPELQS